jgi:DNA-binding NtrC family response regulator
LRPGRCTRRARGRRGRSSRSTSAALPEELFEAELFGHEGGAFTGADNARPGLLEGLSGGTLLLDDVEHLTPASQAKLLQVLGSGHARRLGGLMPYTVDVRVLASTAADLPKLVERGAFRADLYFRLRAVEIALPPLRERRGDVAALALHFVEVHAARLERPRPEVDRSALEALEAHDWPGNVRELESLLLRALVELSAGEALRAENLRSLLPCRRTTSCELAPRCRTS